MNYSFRSQIFGILGRNGSGKSLLINLIVGCVRMTSGKVIIEGKNLRSQFSEILTKTNYSPQTSSSLSYFTASQILRYHCLYFGINKNDIMKICTNLAKVLGFYSYYHTKISDLSDGYIRRLSVAIALLGNPHTVFLDSPTTNLDLSGRREMWKLLELVKQSGITVIFSSVKSFEIQRISDRMIILSNGKLKFVGNSKELSDSNTQYYLLFMKIRSSENKGRLFRKTNKYLTILTYMELKFPRAILR